MYGKIISTINTTVKHNNRKHKFWKEPLIAVISAKNEKLKTLRKIVSPEHLMPHDILPGAKSIVSFFIPFADYVAESNITGTMASKEWAEAYIKTNDLITEINSQIEFLMNQNGHKTGKIPATHNFDEKNLISNWSHRHIAYIAGLGTFGINNMLITKTGCCGRTGSIIISYEFDVYEQIHLMKEKCLNKQNGSCGICRKKCAVKAWNDDNFDRHKCYEQCLRNAEHFKSIGLADVCGKCLVGLPCSTKEPKQV